MGGLWPVVNELYFFLLFLEPKKRLNVNGFKRLVHTNAAAFHHTPFADYLLQHRNLPGL